MSHYVQNRYNGPYKLFPISQEVNRIYGIKWKLLEEVPKIFNMLFKAICRILENNYNVKNILHLLSLVVILFEPPPPPPRRKWAEEYGSFDHRVQKLEILISQKKTSVVPESVIDFLDIVLNFKFLGKGWNRERNSKVSSWKSLCYVFRVFCCLIFLLLFIQERRNSN